MTKTQAATVAGDLVAAGYDAHAYPVDGGTTVWQVDAAAITGTADCAVIQTFATNHGVTAKTSRATFS